MILVAYIFSICTMSSVACHMLILLVYGILIFLGTLHVISSRKRKLALKGVLDYQAIPYHPFSV